MRNEVPGVEESREKDYDTGVNSVVARTTKYESTADLLKDTQASSKNRFAIPNRTIMNRFVIPPAGMTRDEFFLYLDVRAVKHICAGAFTDIQIWERITLDTKFFYGINVSLHLIRKRLWNLSLRHVIFREKNGGQRYFLHDKWKAQILQAILHEQPDALTCGLCDHFCYGSKACKLGYDPSRINCEENTHWDFLGEE